MVVSMSGEGVPLESFGKALNALLKQPALEFSRKLRSSLDENPEYLKRHEAEIFLQVQRLLSDAGIYWDEKVLRERLPSLVREIVSSLRAIEKKRE